MNKMQIFLFFFLVHIPFAIFAENSEIIVSMGGGWPPYLIINNSSSEIKGSGMLLDIFNEVVAQSPYKIKLVAYPEKRDIKLLEKGLIDFRFDGLNWVDNPERFYWTEPIIDSEDVLVSAKSQVLIFERITDLVGKTMICHLGYTYPTFESFFKQSLIKRIDAPSHLSMLEMVNISRGDAAIMNKNVALWVLKRNKKYTASDFYFSKPVDASQISLLCLDKKWIPFIEYFNHHLSILKSTGRISSIVKKYQ